MKRFIKKVLILVSILILVLFSIEFLYRKNNNFDGDNTFKFKNIPNSLDICNLGSSHGELGINYENLSNNYTCFNFALSAQTISYDYRVLKNYKNHLKENTIVIIPISYFSLYGKTEEDTEGFKQKNKRYYPILDNENIIKYNIFTDIYMKFQSLESSSKNLFLCLINKSKPNNVFNERYQSEGSYDIASKDVVDVENNYDNCEINEIEVEALFKIVELCREVNAYPVFITTPFTRVYNNHMCEKNANFINDFKQLVNSYSDILNVKYYDFSTDNKYVDDYTMFFDCQHLNKKGAILFTDELLQIILDDKNSK